MGNAIKMKVGCKLQQYQAKNTYGLSEFLLAANNIHHNWHIKLSSLSTMLKWSLIA